MQLMFLSRRDLERQTARSPADAYHLISFRDPFTPAVQAPPGCVRRLDLECYDVRDEMPDLPGPNELHAKQIVTFVKQTPEDGRLLIQCEAGVGRSAAVAAAVMEWLGRREYARQVLAGGTYNRRLYQRLRFNFDMPLEDEPLVAIAVRVKYPLDRAAAFMLSLQRQRYENWRAVFVFDGQRAEFGEVMNSGFPVSDSRWRYVSTKERLGLWGHPHRQRGMFECQCEFNPAFIGLNNDDNYLTPGYLEQLVGALQSSDADFAICEMLHAYSGWAVVPAEPKVGCADVGNWLASAELIRQVQWEGTDFEADGRFVERLAAKARRVVKVRRPLICKN